MLLVSYFITPQKQSISIAKTIPDLGKNLILNFLSIESLYHGKVQLERSAKQPKKYLVIYGYAITSRLKILARLQKYLLHMQRDEDHFDHKGQKVNSWRACVQAF
mmetsp:Transcript_7671/g.11729  ORF Transcript_7671/g.11729 Transcript_7671/m.11729 type:complete len:105 (+) Transcript_7671:74-388(+)